MSIHLLYDWNICWYFSLVIFLWLWGAGPLKKKKRSVALSVIVYFPNIVNTTSKIPLYKLNNNSFAFKSLCNRLLKIYYTSKLDTSIVLICCVKLLFSMSWIFALTKIVNIFCFPSTPLNYIRLKFFKKKNQCAIFYEIKIQDLLPRKPIFV